MMPDPEAPCPLCGGKPKMYATNFRGEPQGFVLSCVGEKHNVTVFKIGSPEATVAEWDRRLRQKASAA
jgi:hypothetical protein